MAARRPRTGHRHRNVQSAAETCDVFLCDAHAMEESRGSREALYFQGIFVHASVNDPRVRGGPLEARQVPYFAGRHIHRRLQPPTAAGTYQLAVAAFSAYPKLQGLLFFVDFVLEDSITRPSQDSRPIVVPQPDQCTSKATCNLARLSNPCQIPAQSPFSLSPIPRIELRAPLGG